MSGELILLLAFVGFGIGVVKSAFGLGSGPIFVPLLALFMEPRLVVGLTAPLMLVTDLTTMGAHWRRWDWEVLRLLVPSALVGIVIGSYFLAWAPTTHVRRGIGAVAVAFALVQAWRLWGPGRRGAGATVPARRRLGLASLFGLGGGVASAVAHSGGLVFAFYLLPRLGKVAFVASLVTALLVNDAAKVFTFLLFGVVSGEQLAVGFLLSPLMLAGSRLGERINGWLPERYFLAIVTLLVFATGCALLLRSGGAR